MQETRNNCFGLKIRSTILRHAKTGKHECQKATAKYFSAFVLTCFRLTKRRATYFRSETIVASLMHLMVLLCKVLFNHSWKRQLWCFIVIFFLRVRLRGRFLPNFIFFFLDKPPNSATKL